VVDTINSTQQTGVLNPAPYTSHWRALFLLKNRFLALVLPNFNRSG